MIALLLLFTPPAPAANPLATSTAPQICVATDALGRTVGVDCAAAAPVTASVPLTDGEPMTDEDALALQRDIRARFAPPPKADPDPRGKPEVRLGLGPLLDVNTADDKTHYDQFGNIKK